VIAHPVARALGAALTAALLLTSARPSLAQPIEASLGGNAADAALAGAIGSIIDTWPLDGVHWGIQVTDAETGEIRFSTNERRRFVPASNMKIVVSAAALLERGPDWRFTTEVWSVAPVDAEGRVRGNLVVPASGDPTLSERFWDDDEAPLRAIVDSLLSHGVTSVDGALVLDRTAWDTLSVPGSWMVGNVPSGFSAAPATFAIGEGVTRIEIRGAEEAGEPALVRRVGGGTPGFVAGEVVSIARSDSTGTGVDIEWGPESQVHRVRGDWRVERIDTLAVATRAADREAAYRLLQLMDSAGIVVRDGLRIVSDTSETVGGGCLAGRTRTCDAAAPVVVLESPPLIDIVKALLEPSQNWITEQVMRSMAMADEPLVSRGAALDSIEAVLGREAGVDSLDLYLQDGSGLSAYNLVTPRAISDILARMLQTPYADLWRDALAAPGEDDSTLEYRLDELDGRVEAKTGTISNVNSLSGYVLDDAGRRMIFSILTNGSGLPSGRVRSAIDDVVLAIAATPRE
jgi:D-alanyl-D-alanine carboxypeptidase/D-alanyl-D-alanine-endopeptidase (penicillin-binding protein 4)